MLVLATPRSNMSRAATPTMRVRVASPLRVNRGVLSGFSACRSIGQLGLFRAAPTPGTPRGTWGSFDGIGGEHPQIVDGEPRGIGVRPLRSIGKRQSAAALVSADDDQGQLPRIGAR